MNTSHILSQIGHSFNRLINTLVEPLGLLVLTLKEIHNLTYSTRRKLFWLLFKRLLFNSGVKATSINTGIACLLGVVLMSQAYTVFPAGSGVDDYYGHFFLIVIIRELGPIISGVILIARSATTVTAEVSLLKVNNEFEVLHMQRMSPVFIFLLPVVLAFPISLLLMFFYFNIVCGLTSWLIISQFYHIDLALLDFTNSVINHITAEEVFISLAKAIIGGCTIGLLCIHFGSKAQDKLTDVSSAIANSTTAQLFFFFAINVLLSLIAYR